MQLEKVVTAKRVGSMLWGRGTFRAEALKQGVSGRRCLSVER
jgi:hypothetical protein